VARAEAQRWAWSACWQECAAPFRLAASRACHPIPPAPDLRDVRPNWHCDRGSQSRQRRSLRPVNGYDKDIKNSRWTASGGRVATAVSSGGREAVDGSTLKRLPGVVTVGTSQGEAGQAVKKPAQRRNGICCQPRSNPMAQ